MLKKNREKGKEEEARGRLRPETRRGIAVVILFALAILVFLSLLDLAGRAGQFLEYLLKLGFGWGSWVFPLILILVGFLLLRSPKHCFKIPQLLALVLLVLSFLSLLHLTIPLEETKSVIGEGQGGGYLGLALSYPLRAIMGLPASLIVLAALLIISFFILFNASLKTFSFLKQLWLVPREKITIWRYSQPPREVQEDQETQEAVDFTERELQEGSLELSGSEKPQGGEEKKIKIDALSDAFSRDISSSREIVQVRGEDSKKTSPRPKISLPLDLLSSKKERPTSGDIKTNLEKIRKTLENFGIPVEMGEVKVGPTVTQYTLRPAEGIKVSQITTLQNDLALALAAHPIRIEAPIPGRSLIGIEVPNERVATVNLREILESEAFQERKSSLSLALGKDVSGHAFLANLERMPHLLIAGSTGSGKTVSINSIIVSLLYQNQPEELKFILIDPKRVELVQYDGIPYLLTPVITEVAKTINALKWVVGEMDRRFELLSRFSKRNIQVYNKEMAPEKMSYLVVVIDELADLMATAAPEVEALIIRLAQMARAVGIHLVLSTQRPSVDIITGLIKANITSRIAFAVASIVDSRTILDFGGAEKLLGRGDMLYISPEVSKPKRLQGAYVSDSEISRIVNFLKAKERPEYDESVTLKHALSLSNDFTNLEGDELLPEAREIVIQTGKASASLFQRRLRVGYARAARLLDLLEEEGIIGPGLGAKPREVLIGEEGMRTDF